LKLKDNNDSLKDMINLRRKSSNDLNQDSTISLSQNFELEQR
jgi:hypothetical protein